MVYVCMCVCKERNKIINNRKQLDDYKLYFLTYLGMGNQIDSVLVLAILQLLERIMHVTV